MTKPPKGYRLFKFGPGDVIGAGWWWERIEPVRQGPYDTRDEALDAARRDQASFSKDRSERKTGP